MSEVLIRPAHRDDLPSLAVIEREADRRFAEAGHPEFLDGETIPEDVARRAIDDGRITVAELDRAVVGWLFVTRMGGELCVGQVSVSPAYGRRGIGTALLRELIAQARARGEGSIVLNTQSDVAWNMPWYACHGFVVVPLASWNDAMRAITDAQRAHGLDWTTRVHMRLTLGPTT